MGELGGTGGQGRCWLKGTEAWQPDALVWAEGQLMGGLASFLCIAVLALAAASTFAWTRGVGWQELGPLAVALALGMPVAAGAGVASAFWVGATVLRQPQLYAFHRVYWAPRRLRILRRAVQGRSLGARVDSRLCAPALEAGFSLEECRRFRRQAALGLSSVVRDLVAAVLVGGWLVVVIEVFRLAGGGPSELAFCAWLVPAAVYPGAGLLAWYRWVQPRVEREVGQSFSEVMQAAGYRRRLGVWVHRRRA